MKNAFKFLSLGVLAMAFYAVSATSIFAQTSLEDCQKIYQVLVDNRKGPEVQKFRTALASGKEYLEKCSALEGQEQVKDYVTKQIPSLEQKIKDGEKAEIEKRFNDNITAKNFDGAIAAAKELIGKNQPYSLDLMLVIATIGYDSAAANPPVDKYNQEAITYAKLALQKMSEGATSGSGDDYGFFQYAYKTKECEGKLNATGWMNYIIGFINYSRLNQKKEGVSYIYKASQNGCFTKTYPEAYRLIGAWYLDETIRLNEEYKKKTHENGDKENDETLAMLAMIKGYAERAADAYARAYKLTTLPTWKGSAQYKENLLKRVKDMYDVRYDDMTKVDAYIAEVSTKPFVDPATPVTPVVEAAPATGTPTTSSNLTSSTNDTAAEATARPASNTGATTTSPTAAKTATTTAAKTATTPTKKPAAKKPAPKKKGTR